MHDQRHTKFDYNIIPGPCVLQDGVTVLLLAVARENRLILNEVLEHSGFSTFDKMTFKINFNKVHVDDEGMHMY